MTRKDVVNSLAYQATTEAVNRYKTNKRLHIESFVDGADYGYNHAVDKVVDWLLNNLWSPISETREDFVNRLKQDFNL